MAAPAHTGRMKRLAALAAVALLAAAGPAAAKAAPKRTTTTVRRTATTKPAPKAALGSRSRPLALGQAGRVGDFNVAVVGYTRDATAAIMGANQYNTPAGAGNLYSMVRLRVTYKGTGEGNAGFELSVGYVGNDNRVYKDTSCLVTQPDAMSSQPELFPGGSAEGNYCMKMPAAVTGTGAVFVEPLVSFKDAKVWWR